MELLQLQQEFDRSSLIIKVSSTDSEIYPFRLTVAVVRPTGFWDRIKFICRSVWFGLFKRSLSTEYNIYWDLEEVDDIGLGLKKLPWNISSKIAVQWDQLIEGKVENEKD